MDQKFAAYRIAFPGPWVGNAAPAMPVASLSGVDALQGPGKATFGGHTGPTVVVAPTLRCGSIAAAGAPSRETCMAVPYAANF
jgi:hypothetical protein